MFLFYQKSSFDFLSNNVTCMVEIDDQQVINRKRSPHPNRVLAKAVHEVAFTSCSWIL
jgi:hypothetical protein